MYSNLPTSPKLKTTAQFGAKKQSSSGTKSGANSSEKKSVGFKSRNTG